MTVDRWKLISYCLCDPSTTRGHFEKSSDELAVWVLLRDHEAEVNGLLIENSNLRGVRDQLLADHQQYADWVSPQLERLGREMLENERLREALRQLEPR
jgi:hypothetical protein